MSMSQQYVAPAIGLAGVNYTPNMNGINYSPMSGVEYTPNMRGMPQLNGPDFGAVDYGGRGGYHEDRRFSNADFGGMSMDAGSDEPLSEDDITDDSMSGGGMG
jgi:hypothetical protein